ncbi:hypothetical protein ACEYW6_28300 [Nostoc sp. UIC 10607]|uniref:hypothetical protein n=1 Tax=Nostoc sp. UIC 10607 TaxID=3045935 RepID=UPI0039A1DBD5
MRRSLKFIKISVISILVIWFYSQLFSALSYAQTASQANSKTGQPLIHTSQLLNGAILAIISATLGFLANIFLEGIKRKNQSIKQITYTIDIKEGIVGKIEKDIKNKVSISYNGKTVKNLYYVIFDVENTGNSQITNHQIRFEFPKGSEIIDTFVVNQQQEMDLQIDSSLGENQKIYKIGTLATRQNKKSQFDSIVGQLNPQNKETNLQKEEPKLSNVGFRFIVKTNDDLKSNDGSPILKYYQKNNNNEEVNFIERGAKKVSDEIGHIQEFLKFSFIVFIILPLLKNLIQDNIFILEDFRLIISLLISLIIIVVSVIFILPRISKFLEAVVNILSSSSRKYPDIQAEKIAFLALEGANVNVEKFTMAAEENTNRIS